ncbi:hypothetical protein [Myceligenerans salitolerans]|uniref:Uncharacterized protein n=1 Tax=Myceligenerans salitolerans TaxID=1230528 RepID=A0ABS3IDX1_9MICO|nr:hypothetical protein [Myceligenerans salitolerans]MBO0610217.1 hypothetical protein [Myceligenerans salitolerans]
MSDSFQKGDAVDAFESGNAIDAAFALEPLSMEFEVAEGGASTVATTYVTSSSNICGCGSGACYEPTGGGPTGW